MLSGLVTIGSHSERIPGKNWQCLGGKPLYRWMVEKLTGWDMLSEVVVVVDAHVPGSVVRDLQAMGARTVLQPEGKGSASNTYMEVIAAGVEACKGGTVLMTNVTNPFLRRGTAEQAAARFVSRRDREAIDSLEAVERMYERFYGPAGGAVNFERRGVFQRLQDLPAFYRQAQVLWIFTRASFRKMLPVGGDARVGENHHLFEVSGQDLFDIDTWDDLNRAECLLRGGLVK